jgi:adenylate kinase family enzyme
LLSRACAKCTIINAEKFHQNDDNAEKIKQYQKKYREKNKNISKEYQKRYRENNKTKNIKVSIL